MTREPKLRLPRLGVDPARFSKATGTAPCGTYGGVSKHNRAGEPVCEACRQAATEYAAWRRFKTGHIRNPKPCPSCGSVFPRHRCGMVTGGAL